MLRSPTVERTAWRLGHRPALDGLRGLAVLAVIAYHGWPALLPGGWVGVEVFFVLSGFLITSLLLEEHAGTGTVRLRAFYARRARRLLPALGVFVAGCIVIGPWAGWKVLAVTSGYVTNLVIAYVPGGTVAYGHTWSLALEEQFYLLWPLTLLLLMRCRPVVRVWALSVAIAAVAVLRLGMSGRRSWTTIYYGPFTHADGLLIGCLVAVLLSLGWLRPRRWPLWAGGAILALWAATVSAPDAFVYRWGLLLVGVASAGVLVGLLSGHAAFEISWLRSVGRWSYGLYLFHPVVFYAMKVETHRWLVAPAIGVSLGIACASYRWIESPLLSRSRRSPTSRTHQGSST